MREVSLFVSSLTKFEQFYKSIYSERWEKISASLLNQEEHKQRQYHRPNFFHSLSEDVETHYIMDPASVVVAEALKAFMGTQILDLCAAPGGKSLILYEGLYEKMQGAFGVEAESSNFVSEEYFLWANEFSAQRRERLTQVAKDYIPLQCRHHFWVKGLDGQKYGLKYVDKFDTALIDAPCSGERHLLENPKELASWSEARSRNLAVRQYSLLCSALQSVKAGSVMAYSTCSLSPLENDEIIKKLNKKRGDEFELVSPSVVESKLDVLLKKLSIKLDRNEYGWQILPDINQGAGPMYFSLLRKK